MGSGNTKGRRATIVGENVRNTHEPAGVAHVNEIGNKSEIGKISAGRSATMSNSSTSGDVPPKKRHEQSGERTEAETRPNATSNSSAARTVPTKNKDGGESCKRKEAKGSDDSNSSASNVPTKTIIEHSCDTGREAAHERSENEDNMAEPVSNEQILEKFVKANPKLEKTYRKSLTAVKGVKDCLESGDSWATESVNPHMTLLSDFYSKYKRDGFVDFLVALSFPKLACEVLATLRKKFPKATTEDYSRAEKKEKVITGSMYGTW